MPKKSQKSFSLAIHGGAGGTITKARRTEKIIRANLHDILEEGRTILEKGGSALDAVTLCVKRLEDTPFYNAGYGSVATSERTYELDASIMDGKTLNAGAVCAIKNVKNPVDLARLVMEKTDHVMLSGKGAKDFAKEHNIETVTQRYFQSAREKAKELIDQSKKHGTVGAIARDTKGNLAAATSTGGTPDQMPGRIGDTPIIGAGNFADNESGAVSCTGIGEDFMRTVLAAHIGFLIEQKNMSAQKAAQQAIDYLVRKVKGDGGFILIDKNGQVGIAQSSKVMRAGWIEQSGESVTTVVAPIQARKP